MSRPRNATLNRPAASLPRKPPTRIMNTRCIAIADSCVAVESRPKPKSSRVSLPANSNDGRSSAVIHSTTVLSATSSTCCVTRLHKPAPRNASAIAMIAEPDRPTSERTASERNCSCRRCVATKTLANPMAGRLRLM